jgi:RNA polymerase sigma-70 factor (ECF subfamily)
MTWRNATALIRRWSITDARMNEPAEQCDASDMQRLVNGHDAALNDLMERHGERLFHYLIRQLQNESDAADVAQDAFVRVYQHRAKFDPRQKFSIWLYTIATNLARDRMKWRSRHPEVSLNQTVGETDNAMVDVLPDSKPLPDDVLASSEQALAVRDAIAALPEDLRTALILAEYESMPHTEIASVLRCSVKAVESRIYRAKQRLRERLEVKLERT